MSLVKQKYGRIITAIACVLGGGLGYWLGSAGIAGGIIIAAALLGIHMDGRLRHWPLTIFTMMACILSGMATYLGWLNFQWTMSIWVLLPIVNFMASGRQPND